MAAGADLKFYIENTGATDYELVPKQGDLTLTLPRTAAGEITKDGQIAYRDRQLSEVSFDCAIENPPSAGLVRLQAVSDGAVAVKVKVEDVVAGGQAWSGSAIVTLSEVSAAASGSVQRLSVRAVFTAEPTRGTSPVAYA